MLLLVCQVEGRHFERRSGGVLQTREKGSCCALGGFAAAYIAQRGQKLSRLGIGRMAPTGDHDARNTVP